MIICLNSNSQDFKKDMIAMNNRLKATDKFTVNLHYKMYLDNKMDKPYQERQIQIKKDRHYAICKQKEIEYVAGDYVVMVNHKFKKIYVLAINDADGKKDEYLEMVNEIEKNFDSVLVNYETVNYKAIDKNKGVYECKMKTGRLTRIDITIDLNTKLPLSILSYYRESILNHKIDNNEHLVAIRTDYEGLNLNPALSKDIFSTKKFYSENQNKKLVPSPNYKDYEVINQLSVNDEN